MRLDQKDGLFRNSDGVAVVQPGRPEESLLFQRIVAEDPDERMPPPETNHDLTADEVTAIRWWIQSGAHWTGHWALEPIADPRLPLWAAFPQRENAVDVFVRTRLADEGLKPSPPAHPGRLFRAAALDLTGLPPTAADVAQYVQDDRPDAWDQALDRLLASPRFGERMAWNWLDAARYADTNGYQGDRERTMWPWRDWVIDAFNRNLPFDQFTLWQLAGDRLDNPTFEQRLATGFCRNHMINGEGGRIPEENRIEYLFDQTETTATVWLGLTFNCCRCHDHKYDSLQQHDYYGLLAFFNQTPVTGGGGDPQTPPVLTVPSEAQRRELKQHEAALDEALAQWDAVEQMRFPRGAEESISQSSVAKTLPPAVRDALDVAFPQKTKAHFDTIRQHFADDADLLAAMDAVRDRQRQRDKYRQSLPRVMVMEDQADRRDTFILQKGLYNKPDDEVAARIPVVFEQPPVSQPDRRLLAEWLIAPDNPLPARVTVNRFWQLVFGTGLVKTVDDFGVQGEKPSHPELLDWLADEFLRSGWDVKHVLRTLLRSSTYRQSARVTPEQLQQDPDNRLLARSRSTRLPSWMLRDQALAVSGLLAGQLYGPGVKPYQPSGVWEEATFGRKKYEPDHGANLYRRTLYTFWRRIVGPTMLFDNAKRQTCDVKNTITNTPLHALVTLNETTFVEAARTLAQQLLESANPDAADVGTLDEKRIIRVFAQLTARQPDAAEVRILLSRLKKLREHYTSQPDAARQLLETGKSLRNESLDLAEHAAWSSLCLLLLNLDEVLTR